MEQKHIFVIAGESSGDQHAANYIKEHKKLNPNHQFSAIGQQELAKVGVDLIFNSESISVVGIMEVISKYGKIRKALNIAYNHIVEKKPDLIVLVDYVEFNLKIAKFAKSKNIPVLFYIAPQVWAWREKRIKKIIGLVNHLAVVFPFEEKSSVLYLGVSTGTTISHISDIVGPKGIIFGVEHSSRVARDFLDRVAIYRKNIVPIIQDAKKPDQYFSVFSKVDVVYVDIAQPDQTKIAIANCN